jgi:NTE family protein
MRRSILFLSLTALLALSVSFASTRHSSRIPDLEPTSPDHPILALALGGGAALGFAHIGVLQVLEEEGIVPDMITGASMGSIVGGYYCAGVPLDKIAEEAEGLNIFNLMDWKLGGLGFFEWKKVRKRMAPLLGNKLLEDTKPALICVATDLHTGERVALREGELVKAMLASATIPGLYRPVEWEGRLLIDGGLVDEVPIYAAREAGADIVIAIDVSHPLLGNEMNGPIDVMRQAYFIIQKHNVNERRHMADVLIRPNLEGQSFHSFGEIDSLVQIGREAAIEALPAIREALSSR